MDGEINPWPFFIRRCTIYDKINITDMAEEYLKLFDTTAQRLAYEDGMDYVEPYVSYTEGDREIHYNKGIDYTEALTFKMISGGTITFKKIDADAPTVTLQYKKNDEDWVSFTSSTTARVINVVAGDKVIFKGNNAQYGVAAGKYNTFYGSSARFILEGNIMSLINSENFANLTTLESAYTFVYLFRGCTGLTNASKLVLPATTLASSCYYDMFYGCGNLTAAPELPATTMAENCYAYMFSSCGNLTTAPALPATTLASSCYTRLFGECYSLTTAPALPASTLMPHCYGYMFYGCRKLTTAPELPATTLTEKCYINMFTQCSGLTTAPELPATTLAASCYTEMFSNCKSLTAAPALPATTLTNWCYSGMFSACTSLTTAPELPATALTVLYCYQFMFQGCSKLNYIKAMFITAPQSYLTNYWVQGVASTGTFVKNSAATWTTTGTNAVPSGWTVETASE